MNRPTDANREEQTAVAVQADERARARWQWARAIAVASQTARGSIRARLSDLQAIGIAPAGPIPSPAQVRRLKAAWDAGHREPHAYLDKPRTGRPRFHRDQVKAQAFRSAILQAQAVAPQAATMVVAETAAQRGWAQPSPSTVRRLLADVGYRQLVAARHGSRAAELDASVTGHLPRENTHYRWCIDEGMLPLWARYFCPIARGFRSYRPWVVVVRDHTSSIIVGWYLVNPVGNGRPDRDPRLGFDADDVMAALITAASADVAPPSCRPFAGASPNVIRWDNHSTHRLLERSWADYRGAAPAIEEAEPPRHERVPVRRPINNGAAERTIGILKSHLATTPSHMDRVHPADMANLEVREGPPRARTMVAAHGPERLTRHRIVEAEELPDHAAVFDLVDAAVTQYNGSRYQKGRLTRADAFLRHRSSTARSGQMLLRLLPVQTHRVTREGLPFLHRDGRVLIRPENPAALFAAAIPQLVTFYGDPGARGVWARQRDALVFLARRDEPLSPTAFRDFVINGAARARRASDDVDPASVHLAIPQPDRSALNPSDMDDALDALSEQARHPAVFTPTERHHDHAGERHSTPQDLRTDFDILTAEQLRQAERVDQYIAEDTL
ncbi:MAG: hypothetical protein K2R93_14450 [Gemmatimonadaceae bacterium]|nr:hypothetical protein [Gemmatimonadaceae bacterium]